VGRGERCLKGVRGALCALGPGGSGGTSGKTMDVPPSRFQQPPSRAPGAARRGVTAAFAFQNVGWYLWYIRFKNIRGGGERERGAKHRMGFRGWRGERCLRGVRGVSRV
jgi:hypothetical protein